MEKPRPHMGRGYGFHLAHLQQGAHHNPTGGGRAGPEKESRVPATHYQPKGAGIVRVPVLLHHITIYATVTTGAAV